MKKIQEMESPGFVSNRNFLQKSEEDIAEAGLYVPDNSVANSPRNSVEDNDNTLTQSSSANKEMPLFDHIFKFFDNFSTIQPDQNDICASPSIALQDDKKEKENPVNNISNLIAFFHGKIVSKKPTKEQLYCSQKVLQLSTKELKKEYTEFEICEDGGGNQDTYDLVFKMTDQQIEFDFFKLILLSVVLEQPRYFINKVDRIEPFEMFLRAKGFKPDIDGRKRSQPLEFNQFIDFVQNDVKRTLFDDDLTEKSGSVIV